MAAATATVDTWVLRTATLTGVGPTHVDLDVDALPAVELPGTPGFLTGEPLVDQGVEVDMPNLPRDLPVPSTEPLVCRCRVEAVRPDAVRITIAPDGARVFDEEATWLGIVTSERSGEPTPTIRATGEQVRIRTGSTDVTIGLRPFRLQLDGPDAVRLRSSERLRQVAGFPMAPPVVIRRDDDGTDITLGLELEAHEHILGFGEQFGRVVKNGQHLVLRTEDALGTGTGLAYKPAPVWHSSAGYLGLLNTGATVDVDAGHHRPSVLSLTVHDAALDLYLFGGAGPMERLGAYTRLTGRGCRPPVWAFGYWMGRCRYHDADEVLGVVDGMHSRKVPIDVVHVDPDWLVADRLNTDFVWNVERFGELADFVAEVRDRDTRVSIWEVPYLDPISTRYEEALAAGHLLRTETGELAELRGTPTPDGRPRALVDMTDADARRWWRDLHAEFLDAGVSVFKTDFGEGCPDDAAARDGTPANHLHNLYPLKYNATVAAAIAESTGRSPLVWGRSGWAGSHRHPAQWGGDAESTVAGLQATLRAGLSHALSNPGLWSHDIGGFFGPELTPGLYVRWTQFGALSPLMRAHGLRPREPWEFGAEALDICRRWIRFRYALLPTLWRAAGDVERLGLPMLRPLVLAFPDDPISIGTDDQFLLGPDLLVAPVLDDGMRTVARRVYLPEGRWHRLDTSTLPLVQRAEVVEGPRMATFDVPIGDMPVFVRDGATIPTVAVDAGVRSTADLLDRSWTLHVFGDTEPPVLEGFDGATAPITEVVRHD